MPVPRLTDASYDVLRSVSGLKCMIGKRARSLGMVQLAAKSGCKTGLGRVLFLLVAKRMRENFALEHFGHLGFCRFEEKSYQRGITNALARRV